MKRKGRGEEGEGGGVEGRKKEKREIEKWHYSMVCSSNMNRSMEAHGVLMRTGFSNVSSYGVGKCVRLPHRTNPKGNEFDFGTPYRAIKENMRAQGDARWYDQMGLFKMLDRNINIKEHPEKWQSLQTAHLRRMDVVICFEERVYDILVDDLQGREPVDFDPVHVINLDIKDNQEEALAGGKLVLELCRACEQARRGATGGGASSSADVAEVLPRAIEAFEANHSDRQITFSVHWL